jgi:hypothetical protein
MKPRLTPEVIENHREIGYRCRMCYVLAHACQSAVESSLPIKQRRKSISALTKLQDHLQELLFSLEIWSAARLPDLPGQDIYAFYHRIDSAFGISFRRMNESIHDSNNLEYFGKEETGKIGLRRKAGNRYITFSPPEHARVYFIALVVRNQLQHFCNLFLFLHDSQSAEVFNHLKACRTMTNQVVHELEILHSSLGHPMLSDGEYLEAICQVEATGFVNSLSCSIAYPPAHLIKSEAPA